MPTWTARVWLPLTDVTPTPGSYALADARAASYAPSDSRAASYAQTDGRAAAYTLLDRRL
jgi:hypothetical protein